MNASLHPWLVTTSRLYAAEETVELTSPLLPGLLRPSTGTALAAGALLKGGHQNILEVLCAVVKALALTDLEVRKPERPESPLMADFVEKVARWAARRLSCDDRVGCGGVIPVRRGRAQVSAG